MHVRVCPECGEEFRPEIVSCSDCGSALRDRFQDDETGEVLESSEAQPAAPRDEAPPVVEVERRSLYTSNKIQEIRPLADRLGSAGIAFSVVSAGDTWTVLVPEADEERSRAISNELFGIDDGAVSAFDPESGYTACPACGHALPPQASECPECGLGVGGGPEGMDEP
jgi:hypothetical protein